MSDFSLRRRTAILSALVLAAVGRPLRVAAQQTTGRDRAIADVVTANHILANTGVLDAFGHVSVRDPNDPQHFIMSRDLAPAQVSAEDLITYDLDGRPLDKPQLHGHSERFIHAEVYRARADVGAVVHSHSPSVVPFGMSSVPFKASYHMTGFLAHGVPVFDIRKFFGDGTNMLVNNSARGRALVQSLGKLPVVLMRGHGYTVVAADVRTATSRAVYTEIGATIQTAALSIAAGGPLEYLSPAEGDAFESPGPDNEGIERSWNMWVAALPTARSAG